MVERILGLIVFLSLLGRDGLARKEYGNGIMVFGSLLCVIYFLANWWLDKPAERNARTIMVSILYGITSASLMMALVFKMLYLTGSDEMTILAFIALVVTVSIDLLTAINSKKVMTSWTIWRLGVLSFFAVIFFYTPQDYRIGITYRKHPDFLEYYKKHKGELEFDQLEREYFLDSGYK